MPKLQYAEKGTLLLLKLSNILIQLYILIYFTLYPIFFHQLFLYYASDSFLSFQIVIVTIYYLGIQLIRTLITKSRVDLIILFALPLALLFIQTLGYFCEKNRISFTYGSIKEDLRAFGTLGIFIICIYHVFYFGFTLLNFYKYSKSLKQKN